MKYSFASVREEGKKGIASIRRNAIMWMIR